jgi:hypothetical protein
LGIIFKSHGKNDHSNVTSKGVAKYIINERVMTPSNFKLWWVVWIQLSLWFVHAPFWFQNALPLSFSLCTSTCPWVQLKNSSKSDLEAFTPFFLFNFAILTLGSWPKLKHEREIVKKMFQNSCTIPQVWENAKKMNPEHSQALWEFILGVGNLIHVKYLG